LPGLTTRSKGIGVTLRRRGAALTLIALIVPRAAHSGSTQLGEAAARRVQSFVNARDFHGSALIARGDSILFEQTFVIAGTPSRTSPRYGIGSITKTFTAAALQRLERQGKLRLTDSLSRFIPAFPRADSITIRQLLTHSAGIPDYYTDAEYPARRTQPMTPRKFTEWLAGKPLDFSPGSQSRYSSSGYAMLADVIERVSGETYDDFIRHEFLEPLALHDTGRLERNGVAKLATGFDPGPLPRGTTSSVDFDWSWLVGSGSLYSTPRDLLRWTHAVLRDGLIDGNERDHPYGWALRERHHQRVIEQTGRIPAGYAAKVSFLPDSSITVIVLSNLQSEATARLADDLEALAVGDTLAPMPARSTYAVSRPDLDAMSGRYEMFPGFVLTVKSRENGAWLAGPDGDLMPLDAETRNRFRFRLLDVAVDFERDSTAKVSALIWNGQFRAARVP
jgi:CubicO group peptidase (beta-lactamase class C family)